MLNARVRVLRIRIRTGAQEPAINAAKVTRGLSLACFLCFCMTGEEGLSLTADVADGTCHARRRRGRSVIAGSTPEKSNNGVLGGESQDLQFWSERPRRARLVAGASGEGFDLCVKSMCRGDGERDELLLERVMI